MELINSTGHRSSHRAAHICVKRQLWEIMGQMGREMGPINNYGNIMGQIGRDMGVARVHVSQNFSLFRLRPKLLCVGSFRDFGKLNPPNCLLSSRDAGARQAGKHYAATRIAGGGLELLFL